MRTESECSAHSFWVIRDVSVLMEFTSRHTCVFILQMCRSWTHHDKTRHGAQDTRDTGHGEAIAEVLFQWSSWVSCVRSPVVS